MNRKPSKKKENQPTPLNETEREELDRLSVENRKLAVAISLEKNYSP